MFFCGLLSILLALKIAINGEYMFFYTHHIINWQLQIQQQMFIIDLFHSLLLFKP